MNFLNWYLTESKHDKNFFDYGSVAADMWRNRLKEAKERFKISFDTENDDPVSQREIVIDQDFWDHTKCKFRCEMRIGCGDWENPVCYFRCQIISGYVNFGENHRYDDKYIVAIPPKNAGNVNLVPGKKGWMASTDDIPKAERKKIDEENCWNWLKEFLKDAVNREIAKIKN